MPFGRRRNRIDRSLRERGVPPEPQLREREVVETAGPWDEADAPDDGLQRVDLGSLRLPALSRAWSCGWRSSPQQQVIGATLRARATPRCRSPRSPHRAPAASGTTSAPSSRAARPARAARSRRSTGPFGPELAGTVTAMAQPGPAGRPPEPVRLPARFLGVDGPRWFLRGMVIGAGRRRRRGAPRPSRRRSAHIVVVRGTDPMPVREPLPLTLPPQAAAAAGRAAAGEPAAAALSVTARCRPCTAYGPHPDQFLELTLPDGPETRAGAGRVVLHGGFWRAAYGVELARPLAADLAAAGFAAVAVEYRRVGRGRRLAADAGRRRRRARRARPACPTPAGWTSPTASSSSATRPAATSPPGPPARHRLPAGAPGRRAPGPRSARRCCRPASSTSSWPYEQRLGDGAVPDFLGAAPGGARTATPSPTRCGCCPRAPRCCACTAAADDAVPLAQSERYAAAAAAAGDAVEVRRGRRATTWTLIDPAGEPWHLVRDWLRDAGADRPEPITLGP